MEEEKLMKYKEKQTNVHLVEAFNTPYFNN